MSTLRHKLDTIRRRLPPANACPEHQIGMPPGSDWRPSMMASLRAFSPEVNERDAYHREQEALAAAPPCARCGWRPQPIFIRVAANWGQHGPGDGDAA